MYKFSLLWNTSTGGIFLRKFPGLLLIAAGFLAGSLNGLFGGGGGMVLIPLLSMGHCLSEEELFPSSVCIILPICIVSLLLGGGAVSWRAALPYLLGSAGGGILSGIWGKKIPVTWLHRVLGLLILWGGLRYLC